MKICMDNGLMRIIKLNNSKISYVCSPNTTKWRCRFHCESFKRKGPLRCCSQNANSRIDSIENSMRFPPFSMFCLHYYLLLLLIYLIIKSTFDNYQMSFLLLINNDPYHKFKIKLHYWWSSAKNIKYENYYIYDIILLLI